MSLLDNTVAKTIPPGARLVECSIEKDVLRVIMELDDGVLRRRLVVVRVDLSACEEEGRDVIGWLRGVISCEVAWELGPPPAAAADKRFPAP